MCSPIMEAAADDDDAGFVLLPGTLKDGNAVAQVLVLLQDARYCYQSLSSPPGLTHILMYDIS